MTPALARQHGADIYAADGRPRRLLDFSSTVVTLPPPAGWRRAAARALDRLQAYPQPRSAGLAAAIARRLGVAPEAVLVGNGSTDCLEWLARAASGERVLLEAPFFGEYLPLLQSAGALPTGVAVAEQPARAGLAVLLSRPEWRGAWAWLADPANPSGLCLEPGGLIQLLDTARRRRARLVLDEALAAQRLGADRPDLAPLAAAAPGLFLVRSLSKGLGLPGLRLGYVVAHPREIARLMPFTRPWNVNSLAQGLGLWAFDTEARLRAPRRRELARRKADLLARLRPLQAQGLRAQASDTGAFLLRLPAKGPDAPALAAALEARGLLVRPGHTYGKWGRRFLRLNPRAPRDNARLAKALKTLYAR